MSIISAILTHQNELKKQPTKLKRVNSKSKRFFKVANTKSFDDYGKFSCLAGKQIFSNKEQSSLFLVSLSVLDVQVFLTYLVAWLQLSTLTVHI